MSRSYAQPTPTTTYSAIAGEHWLPVVGYEGLYSVSNMGRVRSEPRVVMRRNGQAQTIYARLLRTPPNNRGTGYLHCNLQVSGTMKTRLVHHLVLEAFVGRRPAGLVACHNDGNSLNARLDNLRWDTMKANGLDSIKHGVLPRGESSPSAVLKEAEVLSIRADGRQQKQIAADYGVTQSHISRIKSRDVWNHI